jgi:hypothetical protein
MEGYFHAFKNSKEAWNPTVSQYGIIVRITKFEIIFPSVSTEIRRSTRPANF